MGSLDSPDSGAISAGEPIPLPECAAFLGASYFRAVGKGQLYGVSARCLAIDAATDRLEEFPAFREFWLVRPDPEAEEMTLLALIDGPSLAGAFEFRIRPGLVTRVRVVAEIFAARSGNWGWPRYRACSCTGRPGRGR